MRNSIGKISITLIPLFYFIYVVAMLNVLGSTDDVLRLVLFDPGRFEYQTYEYVLYIMPFFFFIGYGYLLHINKLEKGILAFYQYRARSWMEIFRINLKNCFSGIILQTVLLLLMMYLISIILKIPIVFDHTTVGLWLTVLTVVACQYLFLLLNLTYSLMNGMVAVLGIVSILILVSALGINLLYLLVLEGAALRILFMVKRGILSDRT